MNTETQAKSGFKTFVTTLGISLIIFSAAYYFLTNLSGNVPSAENFQSKKDTSMALADSSITQPSVFGVINNRPVTTQPAVLAGSTVAETTESTVPSTGSNTLAGIVIGTSTLGLAAYMLFLGPRKLALKSFEDDITR